MANHDLKANIQAGMPAPPFVLVHHAHQPCAGLGEAVSAGGAGKQDIVPDAVEAAQQNVIQKAADELIGGQAKFTSTFPSICTDSTILKVT